MVRNFYHVWKKIVIRAVSEYLSADCSGAYLVRQTLVQVQEVEAVVAGAMRPAMQGTLLVTPTLDHSLVGDPLHPHLAQLRQCTLQEVPHL